MGCTNGDVDKMIERLRGCKPLLEADVKRLCMRATEILVEEGNVQQVSSPITVYVVLVSVCMYVCAPAWSQRIQRERERERETVERERRREASDMG